MVRLTRVEDRPTPEEVYNWKVYANAIISTSRFFMFDTFLTGYFRIGYDSAFIGLEGTVLSLRCLSRFRGTSISLASFKSEFGLSTKATAQFNFISANIVSVFQAGYALRRPHPPTASSDSFVSFRADASSAHLPGTSLRKYGMLVSSAIFILGAGLQCGANSSTGLGIMYAGRIISGFGIGIASNLAPIYVAEIAPPAIRGRLIGMYEFCWQVGGVIGFWINYGVTQHIAASHKQWFIAFAVQLIPVGLLFIGSFFLIESPSAALANLARLRNLPEDAPYVVEEYAEIEAAIAHERGLAGAGFFGPMRTVFVSTTLMPTIFKSIGVTGTSTGLLTTGVYGIIKLIGALVWLLYLVDTFGRRGVLLAGSLGGAVSMYYIGAYIAVGRGQARSASIDDNRARWAQCQYVWASQRDAYSTSGPSSTPRRRTAHPGSSARRCSPSMCGPSHTGMPGCVELVLGFIIARFTPQMFTSMGYGVYIFFASLMIASIPSVYFILPETKQVPLERMEELFEPGLKPWKAHAVVMARVHESRLERRDAEKGSPRSASFEKGRVEALEV
ncbi:hypothetical protein DFH07DRAFT_765451 [Mycena maculata]|uniref:Quinate transporter n=1 Tax=Mycena maculata TaxID=230809 RepID=A0AAD7NXS3_9AGAR|nr:hypothetical protein DFH07DRAFT_765451 [Mycena maculata]